MHAYVYSQDKLTALFALVLPAFVLLHPVHSRAQNGLNPLQLVIVVFSLYISTKANTSLAPATSNGSLP